MKTFYIKKENYFKETFVESSFVRSRRPLSCFCFMSIYVHFNFCFIFLVFLSYNNRYRIIVEKAGTL